MHDLYAVFMVRSPDRFFHFLFRYVMCTLQAFHNSAIRSRIVWQGLKLTVHQIPPHQKSAVLEPMMDNPMQIVVVLVLLHNV